MWLDAGIVPFSTLGWENPEYVVEGYATGAAKGLTKADLPDHAYWEQWFPADWVSEMREQIRLWFYSQHFMSVVADRAGAVPEGARLREDARRDRPRDAQARGGTRSRPSEAFERMGADVMRWQYCAQPPNQNLLFGFGPGREIQRKLLTLWNSVKFFVDYANIEVFWPTWDELPKQSELRPLDRWLLDRTHAFVREATAAYEAYLTVDVIRAFEAFVDDSQQLVHPPLAAALLGRRSRRAPRALAARSSSPCGSSRR